MPSQHFRRTSLHAALFTCLAGALGAASVVIPVPIRAAEPDNNTLEEIVVTARRREESLQDAPVAITALSGETLDRYAVTSVIDMAKFAPGMVVGRQVTGSSASIFMRGIGSTSLSAGFDQSVSFNLDGLPMSRGREIIFSQFDLDRVEVMRGPQALFFGKNTTGGLVSMVSRNPTDEFEASVKGGFGFEAEEAYFEGFVSGPLVENLNARLALRYSDMDGPFDNTAQPVIGTDGFARNPSGDDRGAAEVTSGRLTFDWTPTDTATVNLKIGHSDYKDSGAGDLYERKCGGGRSVPRPTNGAAVPFADCKINGKGPNFNLAREVAPYMRWARDGETYTDLNSTYAILNAEFGFEQFEISAITGYYTFRQTDLNDFNGGLWPIHVSQLADLDQISQEVRVQTLFDSPVNFMIGAFWSDQEFEFDTEAYLFQFGLDVANNTYSTFSRDDGFDGTTKSAFLELQWELSEQIELSAGARWSREERDSYQQAVPGHIFLQGAFPPNTRFEDDFHDDNVSPQVTLTWHQSDDVSFYVAYKEGFKTGGYNLSQTIGATTSVGDGRFDSETAKGWEVGVRSTLLDGTLRLNATIYDYLFEDLQVQVYNPVTTGQVVSNAGELRTKGVEADIEWLPGIEGLRLYAAMAYNDAEFDKYVGQCYGGQTVAQGCDQILVNGVYQSQDYGGRTPPKAPKFAGRLGTAYEFPVAGSFYGTLSLDLNYSDKYNYTDTLRPDGVQDSFTRIDASLRIVQLESNWEIALIGRNLTNEYVITSANDMTFTGGTGTGTSNGVVSDLNAVVMRPREYYIEIAKRF